jgi:type II secretory pathway pseudopilin PulG
MRRRADRAQPSRLPRRRGISLFEAVAALAIVGVTAVSALSAVGGEMRTAERSRRAIEVEALATSRLEYMALMSDQQLQNLPDSVAKGTFDPPLDGYKWVTTAAPLSTQAGIYDVRIQVDWKEGSYAIHSYVYRRPPIAATRGR